MRIDQEETCIAEFERRSSPLQHREAACLLTARSLRPEAKKRGESVGTRRPLLPHSGRKHFGGEVPKAAIDAQVLLDGADPPGANQAATGGPAQQSAP